MLCLVCNHGFSWRIAPLERVCAQCGALHLLKSGLWRLASETHSGQSHLPATRTALRATTGRVPLMKVVPSIGKASERQVKS